MDLLKNFDKVLSDPFAVTSSADATLQVTDASKVWTPSLPSRSEAVTDDDQALNYVAFLQ